MTLERTTDIPFDQDAQPRVRDQLDIAVDIASSTRTVADTYRIPTVPAEADQDALDSRRTKKERKHRTGVAVLLLASGIAAGHAYSDTIDHAIDSLRHETTYEGEQAVVAGEGDTVWRMVEQNVVLDEVDIRDVIEHVVNDPANAETFTGSNGSVSAGNLEVGEQVILPVSGSSS